MARREEFPDVPDWQHDLIDRYGALLINTGGNDPRDMMQRLANEERMASTNIVMFTLCVAVKTQLDLLALMDEKGMLTRNGGE